MREKLNPKKENTTIKSNKVPGHITIIIIVIVIIIMNWQNKYQTVIITRP